MKHVKRENRVETINDIDLPEFVKRGWVEIDPDTGVPINAKVTDNPAVLKAEVERLQRETTQLASELKTANEAIEALSKENLALKSAGTVQVTYTGTGAAEASPDVTVTSDEAQETASAPKHRHKA